MACVGFVSRDKRQVKCVMFRYWMLYNVFCLDMQIMLIVNFTEFCFPYAAIKK